MKRKIFLATGFVVAVLSGWLFTACSDDESKNARIEISLTDAPADYQAVNIDIQAVLVHTSNGDGSGNSSDSASGWRSLDIIPGVYDLLKLANGLDTLLGVVEVPAGRLSQIRLVLGENNTVTVDGETFDLATPSSQQSGLKLNVHEELQGGLTYAFLLDFDVARSIVVTGNGSYSLKPVIRVTTEATSGGIEGTVSIPASSPVVYAILEDDTIGSTFADTTGYFFIGGLDAGLYKVSFSTDATYTIADVNGVPVTLGNITDLGVVLVIE